MFLTEKEILDTPQALSRTFQYFSSENGNIETFFNENQQKKFTVLGCGSSYMLSKGTATLFASFADTSASAIPAGDYIVNPNFWEETVKGSIVIALSRSGLTTEMVKAVKHIKEAYGCPVISVTAKADNGLTSISDLEILLPWIYDDSVCQTRTVTNIYAATLLLAAKYSKDESLYQSVLEAGKKDKDFILKYQPILKDIANRDWNNAVVLADGPVCGIAEEGALAFTEIAMLIGRYFHLLDYRHGPIVVGGEKTLTLILLCPNEEKLQGAMVQDVVSRGGTVVTVSDQAENKYGATTHIQIEGIKNFAAWGIPFIYVAQMVSLRKAIALGGNPDAPTGLDAYITLN